MNADPLDELPEAVALAAAMEAPFRRAGRRHPRRGTPQGWQGLEAVPWSPNGFFHAADIDPADRLDYHSGSVWPQDAASQLPVRLLEPLPGEIILDACAAPGSKSTQIGLALGDDGLLICCDASRPRRQVLRETLARQGVACGLVCPLALPRLGDWLAGVCDGVLVDAPCSGHRRRSGKQVARQAERQLAILLQAAELVGAGGRLVYSTCTPYRAENEGVIAAFLQARPGWSVAPRALPGVDADLDGLGACRLWPQRQGTEPFFAIRLQAPAGDRPVSQRWRGELPPAAAWPESLVEVPDLHCWQRGEVLLAGSQQVAACALPAEARGLLLGRRRSAQELRWECWAAQALLERGCLTRTVISHAAACRAWGGEAIDLQGAWAVTDAGAPLGWCDAGGRLRIPSALVRGGLI